MSVKVFLPSELFCAKENCDIFGDIQIRENNNVSYFVLAASSNSKDASLEHLRHLGYIARAGPATELRHRDVSLSFAYDKDTPNIYLDKLSIKPPRTTNINIFLYDKNKILQLHRCKPSSNKKCCREPCCKVDNFLEEEQNDDVLMLYQLAQENQRFHKSMLRKSTYFSLLLKYFAIPLDVMTQIFVLLIKWQRIKFIMKRTALFEHYQEWEKFQIIGNRNANFTLDKILGVCVMLIMLFFIPHPGEYFIQISNFVIRELRLLLHSLKGSPIGLKLNVPLNNFFLDCFNYHVDLWVAFLELIEQFVHHIFIPITLIGCMGLSYQLAMLADLISVIGLHANCFYIYAAVLYKVEIKGLQVLWKVVLGKRYNVLKNRVESHNYMNRQLYLATMFFTALLFLFPTIIVYYVVFTTLRLCIYLVHTILQFMRRYLLEFPLEILFMWMKGNFFEVESIHLQHIPHESSPLLQPDITQMQMSFFKINVESSSLGQVFLCESGVLQELATTNEQKSIFNRILLGNF